MKIVFLDANIILDFYRFGQDDLGQIQKLLVLVQEKEILLLTNSHLVDEVRRNREKILADTMQSLRSNKFGFQPPRIVEDFEAVSEINEFLKQANLKLSKIVDDVSAKVTENTLAADLIIGELFALGTDKVVSVDILERAKRRQILKNPPGKSGSIGDGIHWECLLDDVFHFVDVVSRDGDFSSEISSSAFKEFLLAEWKSQKSEKAHPTLFRSLSDYFAARFPDIQLSEEAMKNELIDQLADSPNFATTHSVVARLQEYGKFTNNQVIRLFDALCDNSQVGWIGTDEDVQQFFLRLQPQAFWVDPAKEETIAQLLEVDKDEFFLPF